MKKLGLFQLQSISNSLQQREGEARPHRRVPGKLMGPCSKAPSWVQSLAQGLQGSFCFPLRVERVLSGSRWMSSMLPGEMAADSSKFTYSQLSNGRRGAFVSLSICVFAGPGRLAAGPA